MTAGIALAPGRFSPLQVICYCVRAHYFVSAPIPFNSHKGTDSGLTLKQTYQEEANL